LAIGKESELHPVRLQDLLGFIDQLKTPEPQLHVRNAHIERSRASTHVTVVLAERLTNQEDDVGDSPG
jgi:hypothetical protein